jgi:PRTRC genetic system protein C
MTTPTDKPHRIFIYGEHRFDDPGVAYTVEQIKSHLSQYFPELAHATTEEKTLPDRIVEITFRKQVARKGSGDERDDRLSLLLAELVAVRPYDDPLAELTATLGTDPLTLAAVLDAHESLQAQANRIFGLAGRIEQVVKRCLDLPPCSAKGAPPGL